MNLTEQDVRALVRESIERHLGNRHRQPPVENRVMASPLDASPSHTLLAVHAGGEMDDGMCVIEPAVRCTHCGFCRSHGY